MALSTYPKSIDWNSFFKTFRLRNLMLNMSHNHLQLPTVLRLSLSLRILLLTFNFTRERFAIVCLSFTRSAQSCRILENDTSVQTVSRGCRHYQQRFEKKKSRHSCTNIKCRCGWNAQCSGKPHINTNPQRHITYHFNLTFKQSCIFDCLFHINL